MKFNPLKSTHWIQWYRMAVKRNVMLDLLPTHSSSFHFKYLASQQQTGQDSQALSAYASRKASPGNRHQDSRHHATAIKPYWVSVKQFFSRAPSPVPTSRTRRFPLLNFPQFPRPEIYQGIILYVTQFSQSCQVECNNFTAISTAPFIISPGHRFTNTSEFILYCSI